MLIGEFCKNRLSAGELYREVIGFSGRCWDKRRGCNLLLKDMGHI
jgi:hypothetical protein